MSRACSFGSSWRGEGWQEPSWHHRPERLVELGLQLGRRPGVAAVPEQQGPEGGPERGGGMRPVRVACVAGWERASAPERAAGQGPHSAVAARSSAAGRRHGDVVAGQDPAGPVEYIETLACRFCAPCQADRGVAHCVEGGGVSKRRRRRAMQWDSGMAAAVVEWVLERGSGQQVRGALSTTSRHLTTSPPRPDEADAMRSQPHRQRTDGAVVVVVRWHGGPESFAPPRARLGRRGIGRSRGIHEVHL